MSHLPEPLTIRLAHGADIDALERLAALDSAALPGPPILLAESGGELRAAMSLRDGAAIADPFHPSAAVIALLRDHIQRTRGGASLSSRLWEVLSPRRASDYRRPPAPEPARLRAA